MSDSTKLTEPNGPAGKGETQWSQVSKDAPAAPKQPNERDESASSQSSASDTHDNIGKAAYADATGPQQDTDKAAVTDKVYNKSVVEGKRRDGVED